VTGVQRIAVDGRRDARGRPVEPLFSASLRVFVAQWLNRDLHDLRALKTHATIYTNLNNA
jgi:hypothetical protein